jgi:ankyrin repeat protein
MNQGSPSQTSYAQKRQAAVLSRMSEPVGMILVHRYHRDLAVVGFKLNGGRVILKRWSKTGEESKSTLPRSEGYSCSLVFMSPRITRWSLVVSFSMYQAPTWPSSWNSRWNFRFRRTIPDGSSCYEAIKRGDLRTLQHHLSSGELRLTDSTSDGQSLLHVSILCLRNKFIARLNMVAVACGVPLPTVNCNLSFERRGGCQYSKRPWEVSSTDSHFTAFSKICRTPLHLTTRESFLNQTPSKYDDIYECARRLLDNGADIMQQDMDSRSPSHFFYTHVSMKILLNYREDIDFWMQDRAGMTILHWIAWNQQSTLSILPHSHQNTSGFSCLEIKDATGRSMLHFAARQGNLDFVTFLLTSPYATTMSMPDNDGRSLLHYAVQYGSLDVIDLLLDANFRIDAVDARGRTVLHEAADWESLPAVRRLIERGASYLLAYKDWNGRTPLEVAQQNIGIFWMPEPEKMVEYLQSLMQERNVGETTELECLEVEGTTPEIESTTPGVESTTPGVESTTLPLHRSQVSMVIVALALVVLFQSFLLWRHNSVDLHLGSSEL